MRVLTGLLASVVLLWLASVGLVVAAGARPELREADAIVVLGAAQYNGRPSPVFKARLDHALELWRRGLAPRLVFTGGVGAGDTLSEAEVARRYALSHDVPDSVILAERTGRTSAESVAAAAALLRERDLRTALIVSDSYHMLRTELLARRSGIVPLRAPAPEAPIDRDARSRWRFILRESVLVPAAIVLGAR